jgi:hypothetical protein
VQQGKIDVRPLQLSANLAKPLANPWRNRILAELHLRPMSPTQFAREFGGPDPATLARYFRELRDWGFLEVAEELRGGKRRGGVEKVYRAIQRVYFDTPTWETLPHYLRSECSISMMEGLLTRLSQAIKGGTFDTEKDRHLSWKTVAFDRRAWAAYVEELDDILFWITELEAESAHRIAISGEGSIPMTLGLLTFRSPAVSPAIQITSPQAPDFDPKPTEPHFIMSPETAKALADPWRNRILAEVHLRPMSPKQFTDEVGGPDLATIARYFRQLKRWGFLEIAEELRGGRRRGTVEKVYRAIRRIHFNTNTWEDLPYSLRVECSASMLDGLMLRINEAMEADTFDAEADRHLSWKSALLDRQAWNECVRRLDEALERLNQLERDSAKRLDASSGSEEIPATVALLAFRSPMSTIPTGDY